MPTRVVLAILLATPLAAGDPPRVAGASTGRLLARGLASVYSPGDGYSGDVVGCPAVTLRLYGTRRLTVARRRALARDGLHVIAMRQELAPCGAIVEVQHGATGRSATAIVLDRGPSSCYSSRRRITRLKCPPGWLRKTIADLPPALTRLIGHDGLDLVTVHGSIAMLPSSGGSHMVPPDQPGVGPGYDQQGRRQPKLAPPGHLE